MCAILRRRFFCGRRRGSTRRTRSSCATRTRTKLTPNFAVPLPGYICGTGKPGNRTDDLQLLRQYHEERSEEAFAELVKRHVNLVYSTALRLIGERQLAEDVAQVVFIKLASKARTIREGTVLSGWLYRTTQFVAET